MIKYSKSLLSLKPFVESVKHLVPIYKLKAIKGYKIRKGVEPRRLGTNHKYTQTGVHFITLLTHDYDGKKLKSVFLDHILTTLAHELAHLRYFGHCHKHFELTAKILKEFTKVLKQLNIGDTSRRFIV